MYSNIGNLSDANLFRITLAYQKGSPECSGEYFLWEAGRFHLSEENMPHEKHNTTSRKLSILRFSYDSVPSGAEIENRCYKVIYQPG